MEHSTSAPPVLNSIQSKKRTPVLKYILHYDSSKSLSSGKIVKAGIHSFEECYSVYLTDGVGGDGKWVQIPNLKQEGGDPDLIIQINRNDKNDHSGLRAFYYDGIQIVTHFFKGINFPGFVCIEPPPEVKREIISLVLSRPYVYGKLLGAGIKKKVIDEQYAALECPTPKSENDILPTEDEATLKLLEFSFQVTNHYSQIEKSKKDLLDCFEKDIWEKIFERKDSKFPISRKVSRLGSITKNIIKLGSVDGLIEVLDFVNNFPLVKKVFLENISKFESKIESAPKNKEILRLVLKNFASEINSFILPMTPSGSIKLTKQNETSSFNVTPRTMSTSSTPDSSFLDSILST